jgi:hypothetical protein
MPCKEAMGTRGSLGTCTVLVPRPCGEMFIGVILNPRPLGYEPTGNWNYNNLQDAGGYLKAL